MKKLQILIQALCHRSYGGKSLISLATELTGLHKNLVNSVGLNNYHSHSL
jgi:hypothetical protein